MQTSALIIAIILFILGFLGTVLPVLPGAILIYGGMLLYGILTGFTTLGVTFFIIQGLILLLVFVIDFLAAALGTKHFKGSKRAVWGAVIGMMAGLILMGPPGIIIGAFLGAVLAELIKNPDLKQASQAGLGALIGFIGGTFLKLGMEIVMIVYFFIAAF